MYSLEVKVFIAGHTGLVGSALLRTAPEGIEICTVLRSALDLTDSFSVKSFLRKIRPDALIIASAKVGGIEANSKFQYDFLRENLEIQNSLITGSVECGIQNLIFLGSSCIYPKGANQPINESSLLTGPLEASNEGYAIAKISGIRMVKAIYDEMGRNFFSLMPSNLYGPNDNFDLLTSHVPAALMRRFHEAKVNGAGSVEVWGSGNQKREFMHVDDLAGACWYFLDKNVRGELINIGTSEEISIRNFAQLMSKIVGYSGEILFNAIKPEGINRKVLDTSKATKFGWKSKIDLTSGLESTYEWFQRALQKGEVRGY